MEPNQSPWAQVGGAPDNTALSLYLQVFYVFDLSSLYVPKATPALLLF